ncbi:MAG: N-6 DNA methylase [Nanoarchaeota archaeon]|nr:N-6 DNA methylase [Nanoarchaeota archaeon]
MLDTNLKSKINKLWDKFWSGGLSNPITAIEQMSYLIFMKKLEDEDNKRDQEAQFTGEKYKSLFKGHENCKWSEWTTYPAEKILEHVRDVVFPFMRNIGDGDSLYKEYMKGANFGLPTASLLIEAVNIINDMHIKEQNQDTQGDIYEYLLSELTTAGKNGQFRTPRHIINMMVDLANPQIGEKILDPACGTAGFLVNTYQHILQANKKEGISTLTPNKKKILDEESIYGFDIDETMTRIALMNLMMHGIKKPNVKRQNTLSRNFEQENMYEIVLANPPFKGSINEADISNRFRIKTTKTELLFLELMYLALAPSGRCSVIVPEGVLFGNSKAHKKIRELLLTKCRLDAVISMPSGVFKPYAGVSTAVLFFTKGEPTKKVWFYKMEADGFSLDDKRTFIDGKGNIPDILERFEKREKENPIDRKKKYFYVSIEEIKEKDWDLSISKYRKIEYEKIKYEKPEVLKKKILEFEEEIIKGLKELNLNKKGQNDKK